MKYEKDSEITRLRTEIDKQRREYERVLKQNDDDRAALLNLLEDLKASRDQVEQARREWSHAFDAIPDPIFLHDHEYRIVRANLAYALAAGANIKDVIGKRYWDVFPKREGPLPNCAGFTETARPATDGGGFTNREAPLPNRESFIRPGPPAEEEEITLDSGRTFISHAYAIRDPQGGYINSIHLLKDVTERRRAQQALAESEQRFHSIATAAQDAIIMLDDDGNIVYWNPAAEHILGYTAEEIQGASAHERLAPKRYLEQTASGWENFRISGEGPVVGKVFEISARRKDDVEIPIELSVSALKFTGKWHAVCILREITQRKQAEREHQAHLHFLESMDRVNRAIQTTNDLDEMMSGVLGEVLDIFACDRAFLMYPCDPEAAFWTAPMERTRPEYPGILELGIEMPMDEEVAQTIRAVLNTKGAAKFGPGNERPLPKDVSERFSVKSYMGTALYPKLGKPWQFGIQQCSCERIWTPEEERLLLEIGRRLSDALTTVMMFRDLQLAHTVIENSAAVLFRRKAEKDWLVEYVSENAERQFGYARIEFEADHFYTTTFIHPEDRDRVLQEVEQHLAAGTERFIQEYRVVTKDGRTRWVEDRMTVVRDANGKVIRYDGVVVDHTERKQVAEALAKSEHLRRLLLDTLTQKVIYKDGNSVYITCNKAYADDLGITPDSVAGKNDYDFFPAKLAARYQADDREVMETGHTKDIEEPYFTGEEERWVHTVKTPMRDMAGNITGVLGIFWDITEQRRAALALQRSEASLAEAQHIARLGSWELDLVDDKLVWSDEVFRIFEIDPSQFKATYRVFLASIHPDDREKVDRCYNEHLSKRAPYDIVHRLLLPGGRIKYVHERCETTYEGDKPVRSVGTVQDITAKELANLTLERINRALKTLSAGNEVLVRAADEPRLLEDMCRIIVDVGGYRMAWVGFAQHDEEKSVRPMAQKGISEDYPKSIRISWADTELGRGPIGTAIRSGRRQIVNDVKNVPAFAPWREQAVKYGFAALIALPLARGDGEVFGALGIYAEEADSFDEEEIRLLQELATDLSYGIINLRVREERTKATAELRQSLVETIRAISLTVEKRDPYTSGHQNKVAQLCVAIGEELGLDAERLEGLRLGATIHDIGKIYVPAEILNRPGRLSDPELEIIKTHAQVGYDIIKDVKFPWPVGEMILQHHERLDGSGYPNGLKGDEILLESRILAVADVVEAMSSHRPYRAALGFDDALREIQAHRGTRYDPSVVDACQHLFRDRGFRFT